MSTMETTGEQVAHHENFWYEDGNLVLQAETTLFKVHRGVLVRQSDLIRDILALPAGNPGDLEGTETRPLFLPDVSPAGLANLFKMMYNLWGSELPLSDDEFVDVLLTAHRLQVHGAIKIVMGILDRRLPAERKLQLGLRCDLEFWQLRAFQELVLGFQPMQLRAEPLLSDSVWLKVYSARAQVSQARIECILSALSSSACGHVVAALVSTLPFAPLNECWENYNDCFARLRVPVSSRIGTYKSSSGTVRENACCSSASFIANRGPDDKMHTVLLSSGVESAIIAAVWDPPRAETQ